MVSILIRYDEAMSDTRLLLEITPKGILSFGDETKPIKLSSLNVLIGTNGSGKSNLIDVIGLVRATGGDLAGEFIENGGLKEWIWKGNEKSALLLETKTAGVFSTRHLLEIYALETFGFFIAREEIESITDENAHSKEDYFVYKNEKNKARILLDYSEKNELEDFPMESLRRNQSIIQQFRDPRQNTLIQVLSTIYPQIRIYREWSFGRKNILRNPKSADSRNDYLAEDYSNLGLVLSRSSVNPDFKNAILENLRLLYQGLTDFNVLIQGGTTQIFLTEGKFSIPATRLSDGTLRYLCLLAILCDPKPLPLICIEEPELGLHPDILPSLAQLLVTAATRTQLIVTTHSEILIDALTDYPEYVLICEKTDGQTQIKNLDAEKLKIWLEDYRLGQLWMRGQLGGTRW